MVENGANKWKRFSLFIATSVNKIRLFLPFSSRDENGQGCIMYFKIQWFMNSFYWRGMWYQGESSRTHYPPHFWSKKCDDVLLDCRKWLQIYVSLLFFSSSSQQLLWVHMQNIENTFINFVRQSYEYNNVGWVGSVMVWLD